MELLATEIADDKVLTPRKHGDARGFFSEVYNRRTLDELGIDVDFVQDNHSLSAEQGVVRGLHFQTRPHAQAKLVRVVRGSILDVAVDIRRASPTFGRHVAVVLSAENWRQIFVPEGFAHGFATLEPNTEVLYKVTDYYAPDCDRGLLWNDPALAIDWGLSAESAILSERDRQHPTLAKARELF
jgi:dTDP-4-dehydrorhamnose 3,5-epimerase